MQRGFTITELAVVLIIASILVVLSIPTYKSVMVTARRGEAKVNLSHIDSLQSVFKVAGSNFTYGTIPQANPVGHNGECSGGGSGWKNELGFRPNRCGELRYQYWTDGGSDFTAVAYGPSDGAGKYIYPDCTGAGAKQSCNGEDYSQGDVLTLASTNGKIDTCRNILEYCPGPGGPGGGGGGGGTCTCNTWTTSPAANTICIGTTAPGTKTCTGVPSGCSSIPPPQSVTVTGTKCCYSWTPTTVNSTNTNSPSTATSAAQVCSNKDFIQTTTDTGTCTGTGCSVSCPPKTVTHPATSTKGTLKTGSDADGSDCTICKCGSPTSSNWTPDPSTVCSNATTGKPTLTRTTICRGTGTGCTAVTGGSCGTDCTYDTVCGGTPNTCTKTETETGSGTKCCDGSGNTKICPTGKELDANCNCVCDNTQACCDSGTTPATLVPKPKACTGTWKGTYNANDSDKNGCCSKSMDPSCTCTAVNTPEITWSTTACTNDAFQGITGSTTVTCKGTGGGCIAKGGDSCSCFAVKDPDTNSIHTTSSCTSCTYDTNCTDTSCSLIQGGYTKNVCCHGGNVITASNPPTCTGGKKWDLTSCRCVSCLISDCTTWSWSDGVNTYTPDPPDADTICDGIKKTYTGTCTVPSNCGVTDTKTVTGTKCCQSNECERVAGTGKWNAGTSTCTCDAGTWNWVAGTCTGTCESTTASYSVGALADATSCSSLGDGLNTVAEKKEATGKCIGSLCPDTTQCNSGVCVTASNVAPNSTCSCSHGTCEGTGAATSCPITQTYTHPTRTVAICCDGGSKKICDGGRPADPAESCACCDEETECLDEVSKGLAAGWGIEGNPGCSCYAFQKWNYTCTGGVASGSCGCSTGAEERVCTLSGGNWTFDNPGDTQMSCVCPSTGGSNYPTWSYDATDCKGGCKCRDTEEQQCGSVDWNNGACTGKCSGNYAWKKDRYGCYNCKCTLNERVCSLQNKTFDSATCTCIATPPPSETCDSTYSSPFLRGYRLNEARDLCDAKTGWKWHDSKRGSDTVCTCTYTAPCTDICKTGYESGSGLAAAEGKCTGSGGGKSFGAAVTDADACEYNCVCNASANTCATLTGDGSAGNAGRSVTDTRSQCRTAGHHFSVTATTTAKQYNCTCSTTTSAAMCPSPSKQTKDAAEANCITRWGTSVAFDRSTCDCHAISRVYKGCLAAPFTDLPANHNDTTCHTYHTRMINGNESEIRKKIQTVGGSDFDAKCHRDSGNNQVSCYSPTASNCCPVRTSFIVDPP